MVKNKIKIFFVLASFIFIGSAVVQAACSGDGSASDLSCGLAGYWTLDAISGTTTTDSSGNGNNGTLGPAGQLPTLASDKVVGSNALQFNGSNYVALSNPSLYPYGSSPITLSAWVKLPSNNQAYIVISMGSSSNETSLYYNGGWRGSVGGVNTLSGNIVTLNTWHLATLTFDGSNINMYVDGISTNAPIAASPTTPTSFAAYIGTYLNGHNWGMIGNIDDVRIYNRSLSSIEVLQLYTQGSGTIINGSCGPAAQTYAPSSTFPNGLYCTSGAVSPAVPANPVLNSSPTTWSCVGSSNGSSTGTTATCNAVRSSGPTYTLTVVSNQAGATGTVTGGSINCGSTCTQSFILSGTQIVLTATGDNNAITTFQGCTSSTATTCTVTVNANTTVTANFYPPVTPADLNEGMVAYYTFDEGSGTTVGDSSFNNNNLSFVGTPAWTAGKMGGAMSFDGSTTYLTSARDFIGTTPITFCSWINPVGYPAGDIGNEMLISNTMFKVGFASNNELAVTNNGFSYATSASWAINTNNTWQHVCVTRDLQGLVNMYVNGSLSGGTNLNAGAPTPGASVHLATINWSQIYSGSMDDVRIYSRVLNPAEIAALYNSTTLGNPSASANRPPTVSAGPSPTITLPNAATLAGVVTDDGLPAGATPSITWSMLSGPVGGTVTFANPNAASTTATFSQSGIYTLKLTASDSQYTISAILPVAAQAGESAIPYTSCGTDCYLATTISIPDISAAIDAAEAANGGTVEIPAGTGTFISSLDKTITKDLIITGAGNQQTIIDDDIPAGMFTFTANGNVVIELTNMQIIQTHNVRSSNATVTMSGTSFRHIISNILFDHVGNDLGYFVLLVNNNAPSQGGGVIYNNTFNMHSTSATPTGISIIGADTAGWTESPDWGSPFKWYIEDNTASFTFESGNDIVDSYRGARFVFRHNTIDGTTPGGHGYDSDITGAQSMEIYNNTFTSNHSIAPHTIRAGTALIWNNTYESPPIGNSFNLTLYRSALDTQISGRCDGTNPMDGNQDSTGYPCYHQPGMAGIDGLTSSPLMEWNNKTTTGANVIFGYNGNFIPPIVTSGPSEYDHMKEGRDYLNDTTCTTGPDYTKPWVANSSTVGQTCTKYWDPVNNMLKGYVPYTYPHPLRSDPHAVLSYGPGGNGPIPQYGNPALPYLTSVPSFAAGITANSATIAWNTNEATATQIEYGTSTAYGNTTPLIPLKSVYSYTQTVSGLLPNTQYHYRFHFTDAAGNTGVSRDGSFITLPATATLLPGDVNGDRQVTIADAELTAQAAVGLPVANFISANAKVDGKSMVNIYDAFLIAEHVSGLISKFPVQG
jgi:hypothetical protein